ncbi:hypothetical protein DSL64_09350 [Dyadobacter luteus]|uniref:Gingipain domain-containing protein n=1 Tax=Dyadobacter luteus TaxID=2259619 RepID=A0A3D8YGK3_9BACT|nr:C25 family cysteine peptidase [Dyadobacter luteus]REA62449.1 hypothetical protein DSL64_09350 [Dyadobacter luteus]
MKKITFTHLVLLMIFGLISGLSYAQTSPWSGVYGNEWIVAGQEYVKVTVSTEGIQRVPIASLPAAFKAANTRDKIQLWHRGQMVALIKVDGADVNESSAEILFYGVLNDGKSDELLYRPGPSARTNTLVSLFSDNSAYFLTVGTANGLRSNTIIQSSIGEPQSVENFHLYTQNKVYKNLSTHDPNDAGRKPQFINSFYEEGRSLTGLRLSANGVLQTKNDMGANDPTGLTKFRFSVENFNESAGIPAKMRVLIQGRDIKSRTVKVHVVNSDGVSIRTAGTTTSFNNYDYREVEFDLLPGDYNGSGEGFLAFEGISSQTFDMFSVSYYTITYPQSYNMSNKLSYRFKLNSTSNTSSRVQITGLPGGVVKLYDVTNRNLPVIVEGAASDFKIGRVSGLGLELLATSEIQNPAYQSVSLTKRNLSHDYLIITTDNLYNEALEYGKYRATTKSSKGKAYMPSVVKIIDLYNEFNYGEPSPVAIRRYVDYMLSGTDKQKYLLLIGKSISDEASTPRELVDNVPTVGYPGSDILLVDGLAGVPRDIPAIPVGRIPALNSDQVKIYREKVLEYEFGKINNDFSWRKNIVHANGGDSEGQVNSFKNFLTGLASEYTGSNTIVPYTKTAPFTDTGQKLVINELKGSGKSDGAGMITFYGHGTTFRTDKNISYVSDPDVAKGYVDSQKYNALFFFGCDVNNIFRNRFREGTPYSSSSQPMGIEWLFAPKKGSITVFANTWDGYSTAFEPYMKKLYAKLLVADSDKKPIGDIIKEISASIISPSANSRIAADYDFHIANIHQGLLLGDPAIKLLYSMPVDSPLPVQLKSFSAKLISNNRVHLQWATAMEKDNSHFVIERSRDGKDFSQIAYLDGSGTTEMESTYETWDDSPMAGINYYRLVQYDSKDLNGKVNREYLRVVSVDVEVDELINIAPNPTTSSVDIRPDSRIKVRGWSIIDVKGERTEGSGKTVDMKKMSPGMYILEIKSDNNIVIRKKVVKN